MKPKHTTFVTVLFRHTTCFTAAAIASFALAFSTAHAATISWDGSDSTAWATGSNWTGDIAPANDLTTDIALFNLASYSNQPNAGTTSVAGIAIGDGTTTTASLTLSGTSLTLGTSGISMLANTGAATISSPLVIGTAQNWANNSANTLTISGAITRAAGSALNLSGTGVVNTTMANTNGIIGGWATSGNSGASGATADWLTNDGSGNLVTYTGYTTISTNQAGTTATSGENWKNSAVVTYTGSGTVNSLVVTQDFDVMNDTTLTLGSGGLVLSGISRWVRNNAQGSTAGSGQITSGISELFIDVPSATGDANNWRIWPKIVDNGGPVSVVKNGPGFVELANANTYTGNTYLNSGTLGAGITNAFGTTGTVYLNGGTLTNYGATAQVNLPNAFVLSGTNAIQTAAAQNLWLQPAASVTGTGTLTLGNSGNNNSVYVEWTNNMSAGTVVMANATNSVRFSSPNAGNANVAWVLNNVTANRTTLDFADGTISFGSMTGAGRIQGNNPTGTKTISAGALGLNDTFSGIIANGAGTLALTKTGAGTMTLTGTNTYTGDTTVDAGILAVDGDAIANAGKLVINGGKVEPTGSEVVDTLFFGATQKAAGTWGATGSGADHIDDAHFTGSGVVSVATGPAGNTFADWATDNAPGQTMDMDHDGDGVDNGVEYFMGESGSAFTANPAPASGFVTWPMGADYAGVYGTDYEVQTSDNLVNWTQVLEGPGDNTVTVNLGPTPPRSVVYDMPTGGGKLFVRLVVKN